MSWFEYVGAFHIHSRYSDGGGTVSRIIKAGHKAGLDYIILTDHETLKPRERWQGWHDGLLLIVDEEISPWVGNHYLALGIKQEIKAKAALRAQPFVDEVKRQGGVGIIAHPFGGKEGFLPVRDRPWIDWKAVGFDGMEIWSYMYDWIERITLLNLPYYLIHPDETIEGPHPEALRKWDELNLSRKVVGLCGLDAHGRKVPLLPFLEILPYDYIFRTLRNHLLLRKPLDPNSPEQSISMIHEAIRYGSCFIGYDLIADSTGFRFEGEMGGEGLAMGDERRFVGEAILMVQTPIPARIRILRDGELILEETGSERIWRVEQPGVYRAEAYLGDRPWIFSNPIYLRSSQAV
jgi:hypothetical protein